MAEDRGHTVPTAREQWIHLIHADGSGLDFYLHPSAVVGVSVDDVDRPEITLWITTHDESIDQGNKEKPTVFKFVDEEATFIINWLDRKCGLIATGTWERETEEAL